MAPEFAAIRDDLLSLQIGYARWQCLKPSLEKAYRFAASGNREEKKEVWGVVEELLRELFQDRTKEILAKVKKGQVELIQGSQAHGFRTHPPLSERAVRKFESQHRIQLPGDYRRFLIHVGNGGAGPAYGLFKLGKMEDVGSRLKPWYDGFVGVLSEPFPHTAPWNDLSGKPPFDQSQEGDEEWELEYQRQLDAWENKFYFNADNVNGAFPICHLGCALRQWLVVTGPEAGNVWDDCRADYGGLKPVKHGRKKRVTFLQWYRFWLDEALRQLR